MPCKIRLLSPIAFACLLTGLAFPAALDRSGWKLSASVERPAEFLAKLIDGNFKTGGPVTSKGRSGSDSLTIDLGAERSFDRVEIADMANFTQMKDYAVYVSKDGQNWGSPMVAGEAKEWVGTQSTLVIRLPAQRARYLRLVDTQVVSSWWQVAEVNVFEPEGKASVETKTVDKSFAGPATSVPLAEPARIDEGTIQRVIHASATGGQSLTAAFAQAQELLAKGIPVKIQLQAGIYRDDLSGLTWGQGQQAETLLVIEGKGEVIWTGADELPLAQAKRQGGLWVFPWKYRLGMYSPFWGAKDPIAHRSEFAFADGRALLPMLLERFKVTGMDDKFKGGPVGYQFIEALEPEKVLKPGQFGVIEDSDRGEGQLFVKPLEGQAPARISATVRTNLLCLNRKSKVVLRGITFTGCANGQQSGSAPVVFARKSYEAADRSHDVLIDRCRFEWNSGVGLEVSGERWTIRDSVFSYNGYSGISTGDAEDLRLERCETRFNIWRGYLAGEPGWSYAGIKFHKTKRNTVLEHLSVGNWNTGLWWDIHCKDVVVARSVMFENYAQGYMMELGAGPYLGERLFSASSGSHDKSNPSQLLLMNAGEVLIRDSLFYGDRVGGGNATKKNASTVTRFSYTRNDPHAKMEPIAKGRYVLSNCLIYAGPRQRYAAQSENWNLPNDAMTPVGYDNVFYREGGVNAFRYHIDATHGYPDAEFAEYVKVGNETNARWASMAFADPKQGDFRFAAGSALAAKAALFPQVLIPSEKLKALAEFRAWCGHVAVIGVNAEKE